jgi:hypothetical protein
MPKISIALISNHPAGAGRAQKKTAREPAARRTQVADYFQAAHLVSALVVKAWSPGIVATILK